MRTLIIGGGLIGLSTAQALLERGEEVLVLEAREGVGLETSFANGGMLTPSLPEPWNGPGVHRHLLTSLFNPRASLKLMPKAVPSLLSWGISFLRNSTASRYLAATADNFRLSAYSLAKTLETSRRLALSYELAERGTLCIFQDRQRMAERRQLCGRLRELGLRFEEFTAGEVVAAEPLLEPIRGKLVGGIWLPDDARGDAYLFCRGLASAIAAQGGELRTGTKVLRLVAARGRIVAVATSEGEIEADCVVVAAGVHSPALLQTVGETVAVQPAKGYSITVDGSALEALPGAAIADDASHAVVTTFGTRLRVVGTAEFTGFDRQLTPARIDNLFRILSSLLPQLASRIDRGRAVAWAGLRPVSDDGRPFIGPARVDGLYINTGHGALGWTMAMGSGHLLADQVTGRPGEVDGEAFLPARAR